MKFLIKSAVCIPCDGSPFVPHDAYLCMKRLHYAHAIAQFRVLVNYVQSRVDAQVAFENLAGVAGRYLTVWRRTRAASPPIRGWRGRSNSGAAWRMRFRRRRRRAITGASPPKCCTGRCGQRCRHGSRPGLRAQGAPYLQGRQLPQRPNDLAAFRFVTILASISEPQLRFQRGGEQFAVPLEHDVSTNNAALNKELVMSGAGLGALPLTMVGKELDDGRLVQLLPDFEVVSAQAELRLAYRERSLMTAKVRAFIDYATSYFDARAAQVGHAQQRPKTVAAGSDRPS